MFQGQTFCFINNELYRCSVRECPCHINVRNANGKFEFLEYVENTTFHTHPIVDKETQNRTNEKIKEITKKPRNKFEPSGKLTKQLGPKIRKDSRKLESIRRLVNKKKKENIPDSSFRGNPLY